MDLNAFWQENRPFVSGVAGGALLFAVGLWGVDRAWGVELRKARSDRASLERSLATPMFALGDQDEAEADHERLTDAAARISAAVGFEPRPAFRLDPASGPASGQYHRAVAAVQDELLPLASRSNVALDKGLGLPALSPTREDEIARYLEALDAIERAARMAIEAGVARVDQIEIKLDPGLYSRSGTGRVERTELKVQLTGTGVAVLRFLELSQDPSRSPGGKQALLLGEADAAPTRGKPEEVRVTCTFVLARLRPAESEAEG